MYAKGLYSSGGPCLSRSGSRSFLLLKHQNQSRAMHNIHPGGASSNLRLSISNSSTSFLVGSTTPMLFSSARNLSRFLPSIYHTPNSPFIQNLKLFLYTHLQLFIALEILLSCLNISVYSVAEIDSVIDIEVKSHFVL
ncbi:hypothetical protein VNO77_23649 [Canavalia gladiata]|uniref:Uncharacterized protein n=1 Tax=Canavalia gladiata TaxID=3824 RepID=A0AAN9Q947_CANGL